MVRVDRFDVSGKMVKVLYNGILSNGHLYLSFGTNENLSSGVYMLTISINGKKTVIPALAVR
jgi:hypothetical protein